MPWTPIKVYVGFMEATSRRTPDMRVWPSATGMVRYFLFKDGYALKVREERVEEGMVQDYYEDLKVEQ